MARATHVVSMLFTFAVALAGAAVGCDEGSSGDDAGSDDDGFDDDGSGSGPSGPGTSSGASGSSPCAETEELLVGRWITPEGRTEQSDAYNTLELEASGRGHVYLYAYGDSMDVTFDWRLEGDCDEIHYDYGEGWLADYSEITRLDTQKLAMQATDGSRLGEHTVYDRIGGGTPGGGTCLTSCSTGADCDPGQSCLLLDGSGLTCIATGCATCFEENRPCSTNDACEVAECGDVDPNVSQTCGERCSSADDCEAGEACLEAASGLTCVPPECQTCWNAGQSCYWSGSCGFDRCE